MNWKTKEASLLRNLNSGSLLRLCIRQYAFISNPLSVFKVPQFSSLESNPCVWCCKHHASTDFPPTPITTWWWFYTWSDKRCMWTLAWAALQSGWSHTQVMKRWGQEYTGMPWLTVEKASGLQHALGRAACRWVIEGVSLRSLRSALSERGRKASAVDPSCATSSIHQAELLTEQEQTETKQQHRLKLTVVTSICMLGV